MWSAPCCPSTEGQRSGRRRSRASGARVVGVYTGPCVRRTVRLRGAWAGCWWEGTTRGCARAGLRAQNRIVSYRTIVLTQAAPAAPNNGFFFFLRLKHLLTIQRSHSVRDARGFSSTRVALPCQVPGRSPTPPTTVPYLLNHILSHHYPCSSGAAPLRGCGVLRVLAKATPG